MKREDIANKIKVNRLNEKEIEKEMDELSEVSVVTPVWTMNMKNEKSYSYTKKSIQMIH
ncbi:hypothetical protein LOS22_14180 [Enterococcus faecium]|nr:hypothetical protein [Enterococcus faecium]